MQLPKSLFVVTVFALMTALAPRAQAARALGIDPSACFSDDPDPLNNEAGVVMERVLYYSDPNASADDYAANQKADGSGYVVSLRGWLYYHRTSPLENVLDRPVVIFNHGYEPLRGEPCAVVRYFVDPTAGRNYVVFVPLRQGHQADTSKTQALVSTGTHISDYVSGCQQHPLKHGCPAPSTCRTAGACTKTEIELEYERTEWFNDDFRAFWYIVNRSAITSGILGGYLADPRHIAILGHSYGGSLTIVADSEWIPVPLIRGGKVGLVSPNVFIAVSPAEKSWNADWRDGLTDAASAAFRPYYVLQPANGRSLAPTKTLVGAGADYLKTCQGDIVPKTAYDPASSDPEYEQAHEKIIGSDAELDVWGSSAVEFMTRYPLPDFL